MSRNKRGPKVDSHLGELKSRSVMLDDRTVELAQVLGENVSDGIRKAVRTAYKVYQKTPDAQPSKEQS